MLEEKVEAARVEAAEVKEKSEADRTHAISKFESEKQIRMSKQHEAERAADLAVQWQTYADEVAAVANKQLNEQNQENSMLKAELEALKARVPESGLIGLEDEPQPIHHHSNASNKTTSQIVLVTAIVAILLTVYTLYYTSLITDLTNLNFELQISNSNYRISLFFIHTFFGVFSILCATTSLISPIFGVVVLCEPVSSVGMILLITLKVYYVIAVCGAFLTTKFRNAWWSRLIQLVVVVIISDFQIHERAKCNSDNNLGIAPTFVKTTTPYFVSGALYFLNCYVEIKLRDSGGLDLGFGAADDDEDEEEDGDEIENEEGFEFVSKSTSSSAVKRRGN